jgi:nuclear pore complex protein Nup160
MIDQSHTAHLLKLPFLGLQAEVDEALTIKCHTAPFVRAGPSHHKVLYSWRVRHGDYRGAAGVLYEWLNKLKSINAEGVTEAYLVLINTLASVDGSQAWLLSEGISKRGEAGKPKLNGHVKRRVVTLEDVRKEYQAELDRLALIENGRFAFGDGDQMDGIEAL